jgi:hypothetical protein
MSENENELENQARNMTVEQREAVMAALRRINREEGVQMKSSEFKKAEAEFEAEASLPGKVRDMAKLRASVAAMGRAAFGG